MPLALEDAAVDDASVLDALTDPLDEDALDEDALDELATAHVSLSSHFSPQWRSPQRQSKYASRSSRTFPGAPRHASIVAPSFAAASTQYVASAAQSGSARHALHAALQPLVFSPAAHAWQPASCWDA